MSKREYGLLTVVAVVSGLLGGILAAVSMTRASEPVSGAPIATRAVRTEQIELVDESGRTRISIGLQPDVSNKLCSLFLFITWECY